MAKDFYKVERVDKNAAAGILLRYHYLKDISKGFKSGYNYGLFYKDKLVGVVIYTGFPVPELVKGMFGLERTDQKGMFELSRLCLEPSEQAKEHNLAVSDKKDSTGICFIGKQKFDEFITQHLKAIPGDIIDENGKVLGKHKGLICYTRGQRKGIGLGGIVKNDTSNSIHHPWYAAEKDVKNNTLTIVQDTNHPLLICKNGEASHMHWVLDETPTVGDKLMGQVRYRQRKEACTVTEVNGEKVIVKFENSQRAVTSGQSLVLYKDDYCLGGGFISNYF